MKILKANVEEQSEQVYRTENKFEAISKAVDNIRDVINELESSAETLESKKVEIIENVSSLSDGAQQNAAATEQITATIQEQTATLNMISEDSEKLASSVQNVLEVINKFKF